ncbi:MAG: hypothetical protein Q9168_002855 [Polycauliona sp. 1 TL-2023]
MPLRLPIIHDGQNGGQRKSRPLSANHTEAKSGRQRRKRVRVGVTTQTDNAGQELLDVVEESEGVEHPEEQPEAVATTLGAVSNLARLFAPGAAALRATRKSATLADKKPQNAADSHKARNEAKKRVRRAENAEKIAQAAYDQGVIAEDAKVQQLRLAAAAVVDRLKQQLQTAKAARVHARPRKLAWQLVHREVDAEGPDDGASNILEELFRITVMNGLRKPTFEEDLTFQDPQLDAGKSVLPLRMLDNL